MKTKYKISCALIVSALCAVSLGTLLISCESREHDSRIIEQEENMNDLLDKLEEFDRTYKQEHYEALQDTRTFASFLGRLWRAAKADVCVWIDKTKKNPVVATGADIGSSKKAWDKERELANPTQQSNFAEMPEVSRHRINNMLDSLLTTPITSSNKEGRMHNITLLTMIKEDKIMHETDEDMFNDIFSIMKRYGEDTTNVNISSLSSIFPQACNQYSVICEQFERDENQLNRLDPMYLLLKYFKEVEVLSNPKDVRDFTRNYIYIIRQSKVDTAYKNLMIDRLHLAVESFDLWYNVFLATEPECY